MTTLTIMTTNIITTIIKIITVKKIIKIITKIQYYNSLLHVYYNWNNRSHKSKKQIKRWRKYITSSLLNYFL